jgi:hypothetical protein
MRAWPPEGPRHPWKARGDEPAAAHPIRHAARSSPRGGSATSPPPPRPWGPARAGAARSAGATARGAARDGGVSAARRALKPRRAQSGGRRTRPPGHTKSRAAVCPIGAPRGRICGRPRPVSAPVTRRTSSAAAGRAPPAPRRRPISAPASCPRKRAPPRARPAPPPGQGTASPRRGPRPGAPATQPAVPACRRKLPRSVDGARAPRSRPGSAPPRSPPSQDAATTRAPAAPGRPAG